ncbi:MAG: hypothetical protein QW035_02195 [Candidatus Anstonellales archaeon]
MKALGKLMNLTKGSLIAKECFLVETNFERARGLMFSQKKCLVFKCDGFLPVHSFFVFFPITLLYIKKRRVVEKHLLMPFTAHYKNSHPAEYMIEVPGECNAKKGDRVAWVEDS